MKKFILVSTLMLLPFTKVNAATIQVGNDTTMAGAQGKSVTLELKDDELSSLKDYIRIEFTLNVSGTTYATTNYFIPDSSKFSSYQRDNKYVIESQDGFYATTVGKIEYKTEENLNGNFEIQLNNVVLYKLDTDTGQEIKIDSDNTDEYKKIKILAGKITYEKEKSNDASLTNLTVSQGELKPAFNKEITEYEVKVADRINSLKITGTPARYASVTGNGSKTLNMGDNSFDIEVTAEDGTKKIYSINVIRGEVSEPSAYLKELSIDNLNLTLTPTFDKNNTKYSVEINEEIENLNLKYKTEDEKAKVVITGNENFVVGENKITIKVTASDNSDIEEYEIIANVIEPVTEESEEEKEDVVPVVTQKPKKNDKIIIIGSIVGVSLLIIILVSILLFKKKKPKKKEEKVVEKVKPTSSAESVTGILKQELYDDVATENTTEYNIDELNFAMTQNSDNDDKTKEFNFKDYE